MLTARCEKCCRRNNIFTPQVHKEIAPGNNKRLPFEHTPSRKANLKQYNINIFGDGPARNLTTGRGINKKVIDGLLHVQKTLETNATWLLSRAG